GRERAVDTGPGERLGEMPPLRRLRIAFEEARAPARRVTGRRLEEPHRQSLPAGAARDEQAGDRPDRLPVDRTQDARPVEARELIARPEAEPADRLAPEVGDQAVRLSRLHQTLERAAISRALTGAVVARRAPPVHAPAAGAGAARSEQSLEIVPAGGGQRTDDRFSHAELPGRGLWHGAGRAGDAG